MSLDEIYESTDTHPHYTYWSNLMMGLRPIIYMMHLDGSCLSGDSLYLHGPLLLLHIALLFL
jgi:hypothetical protein